MKTENLLNRLLIKRKTGWHSIVPFLNCGDPDIDTTYRILELCIAKGIDAIELGIPFPDSYTDGPTVQRSHQRALANHISSEEVFGFVRQVRQVYSMPIVLLADFAHSVKPVGLELFINRCRDSGINGLLLHGLPPLYQDEFFLQTERYGIDPILSLYPNSPPEVISRIVNHARGYIYLVSQYGRSGHSIDFLSDTIVSFYSRVRRLTDLPLLAGFGIKDNRDIRNVLSNGLIDGVIIGSALSGIIESCLPDRKQLLERIEAYLESVIEDATIELKTMTIHPTQEEAYLEHIEGNR